jgi:S1-C subfamily serine protease
MDREKGRRLRTAALTGVLAPGLVLGAAGLVPAGAGASVIDDGVCQAFTAPAAESADLSVADVAERVNPAVVTIVNFQRLSAADLRGISGFEELPALPELPGFEGIPGTEGLPGVNEKPGSEDGTEDAPTDGDEQRAEGADDEEAMVPVGSGSGFIVDDAGHVVTNAHVVGGAEELLVTLVDGADVPATVVGRDVLLDVAVLRLDLSASQAVPGFVSFGDSSALRAGDEVIAIGTALGALPNTVSQGTVNAVDRNFPGSYGLTTLIQHDAEIWHGNSGGPLLNLRGEVVGINTAGIGDGMMGATSGSADIAFAVEGNTVCKAAADLLDDGEIAWPYMGIQGEASDEGQTVLEVVADGPSAAAGLEPGDVITGLDGQQLGPLVSLLDLLFAHDPGDVIDVTVERDGQPQTFQVTLGERPEITE